MIRLLRNWRFQTVVLLVLSVIALLLVVFRDQLIPAQFSNDATAIIEIARGERVAVDRYYQFTADVFSATGMVEAPWIAGLISVLVVVGIVFWIRRQSGRSGLLAFALSCSLILLTPVFLGTLSKDIFELLLVSLIGILTLRMRFGWAALLGGIAIFGILVRPYWVVVGMLLLAWLLIFRTLKKISIWQVGAIMLVMIVGACFGYWLATGEDISSVREVASGAEVAVSRINNVVEPGSPLRASLNSVVVFAWLFVPVGMFVLGDMYHIAAGVLIMAIMGSFVFWLVRRAGKNLRFDVAVAASITLAFFVVSCLFEPDYGSYLRHLVPIIPFMIYCLVSTKIEEKKVIS